jgi:hypothetical protein
MDSPLLAAPGAVPATGLDAGVAAHYGDPYAEQRALDTSAAAADRSHLGVNGSLARTGRPGCTA